MTTRTVISPQKRLKAARLIRQDMPIAAIERETGISKRTLWRWLRDDDDFVMLVHGKGILQVGPVQLAVDHDAPEIEDAEESIVWIARNLPAVLGSVAVQDASYLRAVFVPDPEHARAELQAGRLPHVPDARTFLLRADALPHLADEDNVRLLCDLTSDDPETSFLAFLSVWKFKSGETKKVDTLGPSMWPGQVELARIIATDPNVLLLKARKLGQSTLAVAKCGWVARVRDENARVHLYSYRERAAKGLLQQVKFGLDRLPDFLRLPIERETQVELVFAAGPDDERTVASYPMSTHTSVEETSTHSLLDEAAFWPDGENTLERLEPTYASGTADIVTTGNGPANHVTALWNRCKDGDGIFRPVFLPATARPDRSPEFMERKRKSMRASSFRSEYAMTEADALAGPAEREFAEEDILACCRYPRYGSHSRTGWPLNHKQRAFPKRNPREPETLCKYIVGCDIGKKDATVITALDVTSGTAHVAGYWRYVGLSYPSIQVHIARVAADFYPAPVAIEANSMGQAVIDNLDIPNRIIPFHTSPTSKPRMIEGLAAALQNYALQYDARDLPQLHRELLGYALPDDYLVQDSVMSLAIALHCAPEAFSAKNQPGRLMDVIYA